MLRLRDVLSADELAATACDPDVVVYAPWLLSSDMAVSVAGLPPEAMRRYVQAALRAIEYSQSSYVVYMARTVARLLTRDYAPVPYHRPRVPMMTVETIGGERDGQICRLEGDPNNPPRRVVFPVHLQLHIPAAGEPIPANQVIPYETYVLVTDEVGQPWRQSLSPGAALRYRLQEEDE